MTNDQVVEEDSAKDTSIKIEEYDRNEEPFQKMDDRMRSGGKEGTIVQRGPVISLTRRQLYDEIWEISVAGLAKKYAIPYAQLMKQLKEAQIPIPPSGYWTKLSFGKSVTKPELIEPFDEVVWIFSTIMPVFKDKSIALPAKQENENLHQSKDITEEVSQLSSSLQAPSVTGAECDKDVQVIQEPETITEYGQKYNIYSRETLYKEVWEAPITEVAKRYKVSDVAIHKVCKALDIPNPPRGHWAKLYAGKPVSIIPLSESGKRSKIKGIQTGTTYQSLEEEEKLAHLNDEERLMILTVACQILIPDENERMHAKITAHRKAISEWKKEQKNARNNAWGKRNVDPAPSLMQSISSDTISRTCRIIDALIKAMEPLDCNLTQNLDFVVCGETVKLAFSEAQDKIARTLTKEDNMLLLEYEEKRRRGLWASKPQIRKYDYVYNGKLTVTVDGRKNFRDSKSSAVEERLGDIMIEMYQAAQVHKLARAAHEEAERKRREEEQRKEERRKLYNTEVDKTLALTSLAEDYHTACKIRQYIQVIEASGSLSPEKTEWVEWAKAKADWYDPTVAIEDAFFGKRAHSKPEEKKKLAYIGYWW